MPTAQPYITRCPANGQAWLDPVSMARLRAMKYEALLSKKKLMPAFGLSYLLVFGEAPPEEHLISTATTYPGFAQLHFRDVRGREEGGGCVPT